MLFTFQRPFLFSPVILAVEKEYSKREKHFLGSQPFKDYSVHIAKLTPHGGTTEVL